MSADSGTYTVGWICAVQTEMVAALELLDEEYDPPSWDSRHDNTVYAFGRVWDHRIVIASLPKGKYGTTSAAVVAKDMLRSFPSVKFGLMVGIAGGAPSTQHNVRLGDIVVSTLRQTIWWCNPLRLRENNPDQGIPAHWIPQFSCTCSSQCYPTALGRAHTKRQSHC